MNHCKNIDKGLTTQENNHKRAKARKYRKDLLLNSINNKSLKNILRKQITLGRNNKKIRKKKMKHERNKNRNKKKQRK